MTSRERRRARLTQWWRGSYLGACWRRSDTLDLPTATLALGAQEVLCTAPMLVALSAIMARFHLGYVGAFLDDLLGLDAASSEAVRNLFHSTRTPQLASLWTGLGIALVFYVAVAASTQRCVDAIWNRGVSGWSTWWRRILWVGGQVPMFGLAIAAGRYLHVWHFGDTAANLAYGIALGVSAALFHWWGHHLLLEGSVPPRALAPGALAIGTGVFVLVVASPVVMPAQITDNVADYGLIGAAFILSLWSVAYSAVVVYGTLLGQIFVSRSGSAGRARQRRA